MDKDKIITLLPDIQNAFTSLSGICSQSQWNHIKYGAKNGFKVRCQFPRGSTLLCRFHI